MAGNLDVVVKVFRAQPPAARWWHKMRPVLAAVLRDALHGLEQPVGVLLRPRPPVGVDEQHVVLAVKALRRRAGGELDRLVQKLDLRRLVHVRRVVRAGGALVFLPVVDKAVGGQRLETEGFLAAPRGIANDTRGWGLVAGGAHLDHVLTAREAAEDKPAVRVRCRCAERSLGAQQHLHLLEGVGMAGHLSPVVRVPGHPDRHGGQIGQMTGWARQQTHHLNRLV